MTRVRVRQSRCEHNRGRESSEWLPVFHVERADGESFLASRVDVHGPCRLVHESGRAWLEIPDDTVATFDCT